MVVGCYGLGVEEGGGGMGEGYCLLGSYGLLSVGRRGRRQEEKGERAVVQEQGGELSRRTRSMLSRKGGVVTGGKRKGNGMRNKKL